jgi:hypothetical protein
VNKAGSSRNSDRARNLPLKEVRGVAANLDQRRKQRFQFLRCLYEMSRGSERVLLYVEEVGDAVGLGETDALAAVQYLGEKRLIRIVMGNIISISQAGTDELEIALDQPEQPTTHFPPAQSVDWKPVTPPLTITTAAIGKPPFWEESIREESIWEESIWEESISKESISKESISKESISEESISKEAIREESIKPLPPRPLPLQTVENDSDELAATELKSLCDAIGLDPREITGELEPHHRHPVPQPVTVPVHKQNTEPIVEPVTTGNQEHQPDETDLDVMLEALSQQLPKLGLAPDELAKARAEIVTARVQRASPKPKPHLLAAALQTLLSIRLSMTYRRFRRS